MGVPILEKTTFEAPTLHHTLPDRQRGQADSGNRVEMCFRQGFSSRTESRSRFGVMRSRARSLGVCPPMPLSQLLQEAEFCARASHPTTTMERIQSESERKH